MPTLENQLVIWHFQNYIMYAISREVLDNPEQADEQAVTLATMMFNQYKALVIEGLQYLKSLDETDRKIVFREEKEPNILANVFDNDPTYGDKDNEYTISDFVSTWIHEYELYCLHTAKPESRKKRSAPRKKPQDLFSVHSSAPVYDIGETIARGGFIRKPGARFPQAPIVGGTKGRIEILPFWDHNTDSPLSPQRINLVAQSDLSEFESMQEEALLIATSYNEEMATYFYAMDAYWLMNAKNPDDFVQLDISDLLQYSGKKPVKTHGKYTGSYRPDQMQRAGMMVYGMGFSMVEIEKTIVKGVGERSHFKRLWEVSDMYMMKTLDDDKYIESLTYRPNELMRNVSFGSRRETAMLMSKVLSLDYDKMVTARRLGRYYTWLWRDRAYNGNIDAPITCAKLLERAGVTIEKGNERYARRKLETALDRLETEGIIAQWVLLERNGKPADVSERISFSRWLEMKIAVSPPDVIVSYYAGHFDLPGVESAPAQTVDAKRLKEERRRLKMTLAQLSEETGIDISTLSRIEAGRTKKPRAEYVAKLQEWLKKISTQKEEPL